MNNISFELYRVLYYVAKHKNLTKASNELYISQPAVTQSIRKLEYQIGYKLFYRTKKGMELTNEGQILYDYVKIPVECLITGKSRIEEQTELKNKIIRIGSGVTLIKNTLIRPLQLLKELYPDIKVEIFHGNNEELKNMLHSSLLDMILLNLPMDNDDNIKLYKIEEVNDIFVAKTNIFGKYKKKIFSVKDLNEVPLVLQQNTSTARKFLDSIIIKNKAELKPAYELASYGLVLDFVNEGLGIGFVNKKHVMNELESGELFEIKTDFDIPSREIGVVINKKSVSNKTINKFIEIMKESNNR